MDRRLVIESADPILLRDLGIDLVPIPVIPVANPFDDYCSVELAADLDGWWQSYAGKIKRRVRNDGLGFFSVFEDRTSGHILIRHKEWGVLAIERGGHMRYLVKPAPAAAEGTSRNLTGLTHVLLTEVLMRSGFMIVHSAGVCREGRAQLWSGPSGRGKTTQVLRLIEDGWSFLGDDQVILQFGADGRCLVWPYWRALAVTPHTRGRFSRLRGLAAPEENGRKACLNAREVIPGETPGRCELGSLHFISLDAGAWVRKVPFQRAIELIGESFMQYIWSSEAEKCLNMMFDLTSHVPVYEVTREYLNSEGDPYWEKI